MAGKGSIFLRHIRNFLVCVSFLVKLNSPPHFSSSIFVLTNFGFRGLNAPLI
jgi:hypothetical protein